MATSQNTPRGVWSSKKYLIGAHNLSTDSTSIIFSGGLKISNKQTLTGNSTGITYGNAASALPGNVDNSALVGLLTNSTGHALFINSTGTTHKYLLTTSLQPT